MRRMVTVTLAGVLAAVTTGCSVLEPARRASTFAPASGVCHRTASADRNLGTYAPVPCSDRHEAETFLVGRFGGADAARSVPPGFDSQAIYQAYASCDTEAIHFLGGEWREARLAMRVLTPSRESWAAGERWYRCDLVEMDALDVWVPSPRATSLRNGLAGASPLRLSCFNRPTVRDGVIMTIPPASCTGPHDTEFVGVWQAFDVPEGEIVTDEDVAAGCLETSAEHVRVSARELARRVRVHTLTPGEPEWMAGIPGALCFLQVPGDSLNRSLKGAGPDGLPPGRR